MFSRYLWFSLKKYCFMIYQIGLWLSDSTKEKTTELDSFLKINMQLNWEKLFIFHVSTVLFFILSYPFNFSSKMGAPSPETKIFQRWEKSPSSPNRCVVFPLNPIYQKLVESHHLIFSRVLCQHLRIKKLINGKMAEFNPNCEGKTFT